MSNMRLFCPHCGKKFKMSWIEDATEENWLCHNCMSKWLIVFIDNIKED